VTNPRKPATRLPAALRREQLLDATLDIIVEQGYRAVSMESIARRAGVTKPVLYDRFGSLESLLRQLLQREERRALGAVATSMLPAVPIQDANLDKAVVEGVVRWLTSVRADERTWRLILLPAEGTPAAVREHVARGRRLLRAHLQTLLGWGLRRRGGGELDIELLARALISLGEDAARLVLTDPAYTPERIGAFVRTLASALTSPRPAG
jgi:AcrR family transcriptional regulator